MQEITKRKKTTTDNEDHKGGDNAKRPERKRPREEDKPEFTIIP